MKMALLLYHKKLKDVKDLENYTLSPHDPKMAKRINT